MILVGKRIVAHLILDADRPDLVVGDVVIAAGVILKLLEVVGLLLTPFVFETENEIRVIPIRVDHAVSVVLAGIQLILVGKILAEDVNYAVLDRENLLRQFDIAVLELGIPAIKVPLVKERDESVVSGSFGIVFRRSCGCGSR